VTQNAPDQLNLEFLNDVVEGLSKDQKSLSPKYFYDAEGSALFDKICELDEYYPTRTEVGLLRDKADEIAALVDGRHLIEFGSGSSVKIRILLDAAEKLASYVPVDISEKHLLAAAESIATDYPTLKVTPICADFTQEFPLPADAATGSKAGFFPGSTIGNFSRQDAEQFLEMAADMLGEDGSLVIGVDLKKDADILHAAYNDNDGVTAAFNKNVLKRINKELDGQFDLSSFQHEARYIEERGRIEMHLVSTKPQTVSVAGKAFLFDAGESIHTENSHKYEISEFQEMGRQAGFKPADTWIDENNLFSVHHLRVAA